MNISERIGTSQCETLINDHSSFTQALNEKIIWFFYVLSITLYIKIQKSENFLKINKEYFSEQANYNNGTNIIHRWFSQSGSALSTSLYVWLFCIVLYSFPEIWTLSQIHQNFLHLPWKTIISWKTLYNIWTQKNCWLCYCL